MTIQTNFKLVVGTVVLWTAMAGVCAAANLAAGWDPGAFRDQHTLQIMTTDAEEGAHWSKLWLAVIEGNSLSDWMAEHSRESRKISQANT